MWWENILHSYATTFEIVAQVHDPVIIQTIRKESSRTIFQSHFMAKTSVFDVSIIMEIAGEHGYGVALLHGNLAECFESVLFLIKMSAVAAHHSSFMLDHDIAKQTLYIGVVESVVTEFIGMFEDDMRFPLTPFGRGTLERGKGRKRESDDQNYRPQLSATEPRFSFFSLSHLFVLETERSSLSKEIFFPPRIIVCLQASPDSGTDSCGRQVRCGYKFLFASFLSMHR